MVHISIIVPVYNCEKYINKCIESILSQSYPYFELLLIDDGSTDKSGEICDKYKLIDSRIKVFHETNNGVSHARNVGISNSTGEYIAFVDSDDWVEPSYIASLVSVASKADLIFFGTKFHDSLNDIKYYSLSDRSYTEKNSIEEGIINLINSPKHKDYLGFTWNKLFSNNIIKKYDIKFTNGLNHREDEIFTLQYLVHCNSIRTITNNIYNYRKLPDGLTSKKLKFKDYILLAKEYESSVYSYSNPKLLIRNHLLIIYYITKAVKNAETNAERKESAQVMKLYINKVRKEPIYSKFKNKIKLIYRVLLSLPGTDIFIIYIYLRGLLKKKDE